MWKRYLTFCREFSNRMLEEEEIKDSRPAIVTEAHCVALVAILIPIILAITQLPLACCIFLLYGFGTNIYTVPVTIASVAVSAIQFHASISSFKDYVSNGEND